MKHTGAENDFFYKNKTLQKHAKLISHTKFNNLTEFYGYFPVYWDLNGQELFFFSLTRKFCINKINYNLGMMIMKHFIFIFSFILCLRVSWDILSFENLLKKKK